MSLLNCDLVLVIAFILLQSYTELGFVEFVRLIDTIQKIRSFAAERTVVFSSSKFQENLEYLKK